MSPDEKFLETVKILARLYGLKNYELAKRIGVSDAYLSQVMGGHRRLTEKMRTKMVAAVNTIKGTSEEPLEFNLEGGGGKS